MRAALSALACLVLLVALPSRAARPEATPRPVIGRDVEAHLQRLVREFPGREDERFIKVGGSSVVSRAFLHCFAGKGVELGEREDLAGTLARLREAKPSSLTRQSEATAVGFSLRQILSGKRSRLAKEVRAMNPRFALVFAGPNDVMGKNPGVYEGRLLTAVEFLLREGVMPVLASIPPRPKHREIEAYVLRFNEVTARVAREHALPLLDFHAALGALPGGGVARDGVHPNVYRAGGRGLPCDLGPEGLAHGQNARNLMVLEAMDALFRVADEARREEAAVTVAP